MGYALIEWALGVLAPGQVSWAAFGLGCGLAWLLAGTLWKHQNASVWRLGEEHGRSHFYIACIYPILLVALAWRASYWVEGYAATPIGKFYSLKDPLVHQKIEVRKEPGFSFKASGFEFTVREYEESPNPRVFLDFRADVISFPCCPGTEIHMHKDAVFVAELRLERNCYTRIEIPSRNILLVTLDDRYTRTLVGLAIQEEEVPGLGQAESGCH